MRDRQRSHLTIAKSFLIVFVSSVAFALIGAALGYLIALVVPSYYISVFARGDSPDFNPAQVGTTLGFLQGLFAGLIVGCVVVFSVALSHSRRRNIEP